MTVTNPSCHNLRVEPPGWRKRLSRMGFGIILLDLLALIPGCGPGLPILTPHETAIADAARPLLAMDPDAVWTDCYNRLIELGPDSIEYLMQQPALSEPAAPDDLEAMLHTSLVRLLVHPAQRPRLSVNCFETTFDLLHFDIKAAGRRIGTICLLEGRLPRAWHDLYPADFDHAYGSLVDAEADRQVIQQWWAEYRQRGQMLFMAPPLRPRVADALRLLSRRYADLWIYVPWPRAILCSYGPDKTRLFWARTRDYNLVLAACAWLGSSPDPELRDRLIDLIDDPSQVLSHNARVALGYSPDPRIRALVERYKDKDRARSLEPPRPEPDLDGFAPNEKGTECPA